MRPFGTTCVALAWLLAAWPTFAGRETSQALSPADAAQVRRLAVVSMLGNSISGRSSGLSTLQKRYLFAPAVWQIDRELERHVTEHVGRTTSLRAARIEILRLPDPAVVQQRDRRRPIDTGILARLARNRDYDAVLAILPEEHPSRPDVPAGVSIIREQQRAGIELSHACAAVVLRLVLAGQGEALAWAAPAPCTRIAPAVPWHEAWSTYTPEEARWTLDALRRQVFRVVDEALRVLEQPSTARSGS